MNTPGTALEWAASDGRRGRLVGKGKTRGLGSPSGEAVDSKRSSGPGTISRVAGKGFAKTDSKDAKSEKEANKYTNGQTNDTSELEYKKVPSESWTDDQDKLLFRMKVEQKPWGEITKEFGKTKQECNDRWKEIMPEGFYNNQNKGGDKSGDKGKHDKGKDKKQKQEGQKKAEPEASSGGDALGVVGWDMFDAPEDNKSNASGGNAKNETVVNTGWDNPTGGGVDTGGTAGGVNTWDTENNNNTGPAANGSWDFGNGNNDTNEKDKNGENGKKPPENGGQNESKKPNSTAGGNEWTKNNWGGVQMVAKELTRPQRGVEKDGMVEMVTIRRATVKSTMTTAAGTGETAMVTTTKTPWMVGILTTMTKPVAILGVVLPRLRKLPPDATPRITRSIALPSALSVVIPSPRTRTNHITTMDAVIKRNTRLRQTIRSRRMN